MLQVDLRELARGPVRTVGQVAADDPLFAGLDPALAAPADVEGRLHAAGEGRFYWQGSVRTRVQGMCRRCLKEMSVPLAAQITALFTQDPDALEDPASYPLAPDATLIDLTAAVREEVILGLPRYLVCRDDCRGLCPHCGQDLNAGPCDCAPRASDPRWQALAAWKGKLRD